MKPDLISLDLNDRCELDSPVPGDDLSFWRRQFQMECTPKQYAFDWAYGVIVPLVCVTADPFVFESDGLLGRYRAFAYVLSSVSILAMAAWLLWGKKLGWLAAPLAGLFIAGAAVSLLVGVILLPYSLIGMIIIIGFLGFTPLFSALVYLRNGIRASRAAEEFLEQRVVWHAVALAALFSLVVPYLVNSQSAKLVDEVTISGDAMAPGIRIF